MLSIFDGIREFTFLSVIVRIILSSISAGLIGFERGREGRAAGFRTHILVALGACIVMCVDEYIIATMNPNADPARLGAQVINGIGFLGAGTILATGRRITGLTTAAGLWTTACVGLAYGCGYFEGGILVTIVMIFVVIIFRSLEKGSSAVIGTELLFEIESPKDIPILLDQMQKNGTRVVSINIDDDPKHVTQGHLLIRLSAKVKKNFRSSELIKEISKEIQIDQFKEL